MNGVEVIVGGKSLPVVVRELREAIAGLQTTDANVSTLLDQLSDAITDGIDAAVAAAVTAILPIDPATDVLSGTGASGTFTTADAKTVTVVNGRITSIV